MSRKRAGRRGKRVDEVLAELEQDPAYRQRLEEDARQQLENRRAYHAAAAPLLAELAASGVGVRTLEELVHQRTWRNVAGPILARWLPRIAYQPLKSSVIRALSVRGYGREVGLALLAELTERGDQVAESHNWAIGNALSELADESMFDSLLTLVKDARLGRAREMLVVALARTRHRMASEALIQLLREDQFVGFAAMGLGMLRAEAGAQELERLLDHPRAWVRKEAAKALAKIRRGRSE